MEIKKFITVLYVDDEEMNLTSFSANFRKEFNVLTANSAHQALETIDSQRVDVVITDHMMPDISGVELLEKLKDSHPTIGRILITGCNDINIVIEAINRCEVYRFLTKPWVKKDLSQTIEAAYYSNQEKLQQEKKAEELERTNEQLEFMLRQKLIS